MAGRPITSSLESTTDVAGELVFKPFADLAELFLVSLALDVKTRERVAGIRISADERLRQISDTQLHAQRAAQTIEEQRKVWLRAVSFAVKFDDIVTHI